MTKQLKQLRSSRTGKYITEQQARETGRVPFILFGIVLGLIFIPWGAIELQAKVSEWANETMDSQDATHATISHLNDTSVTIVPVVDTYERTPSEVALWYMEQVGALLEAEGVENYAPILEEMHQYARDTMYLEELDIQSLTK